MTGRRAPSWRLLLHGPAHGAWNLAVDEAILERYAGRDPPEAPTLRLYGWRPAGLSLGRRQPAGVVWDPAFLRGEGIDLVRRPTGGGAVLHEDERTYSVIGRLREEPFTGSVLDTYRRIAEALVTALGFVGIEARVQGGEGRAPAGASPSPPVACFGQVSAHEVTVGGRKLVGSAQLRRRGAFLQHGSIPLRASARRLERALGGPSAGSGFVDLKGALGRAPDPERLDRALVSAFESVFGVRAVPGELTPDETLVATRLRGWKYASAAWTLEGPLSEREGRWGPSVRGPIL